MQQENWEAIGKVIQLDDGDRDLLDRIQRRLEMNHDWEFLHFLRVMMKVANAGGRLNGVRLPKP